MDREGDGGRLAEFEGRGRGSSKRFRASCCAISLREEEVRQRDESPRVGWELSSRPSGMSLARLWFSAQRLKTVEVSVLASC